MEKQQMVLADEQIEKVLRSYSVYYDIERMDETKAPLVATADYHEHETGYMLIRKAEMWSADKHEYVFIYSVPELTAELFETCMAQAKELGEAKVDPVAGHMSSNVVAVFFCQNAQPEAVEALKKYRFRKSFQFSLKGWMEIHTAVVDTGKEFVASNAPGKNTAEFLKKALYPSIKRKKRIPIIGRRFK
ncbi:MAG: hypothetical protein Q4B59_04655 [Lachnospiraceae bacterium]|nr:hypothetical protein [Lachnospiraceae bacterium]